MTATRRFHLLAALIFVFLPVLATAATHEFRVLIDVDNNAATGCTVGGMSGVDHVLVTVVRTDATSGAVERSHRLACSGGSLSSPLDIDTSGWPVGFNGASGGMTVENRIAFATLGGLPGTMRLGFEASSAGAVHSAIALANGSPVLYPAKRGKRHAVGSTGNNQRFFQLDGDGKDWGAINPLVTGIASGGSQKIRMHHAYAFANATDEFVYFRFDANVASNAPFAEDDEYSRIAGSNLVVPSPGVLSNDGDPNNLPLTAHQVSPAAHGDVTLNPDGSFTYNPSDPTSPQTDSFQYKARNGAQDSNVAKVTIKVSAVANHVPSAVTDSYNTNEDVALNVPAPGVMGNDSDADGDDLAATKLTDPTHGSVVVSSNGSFTYTPNPNFFGTDSFTYSISDGEFAATATVTITIQSVNDVPTITGGTFSVNENSPNGTVVGSVTGGDADTGDALSFAITGGNTNNAFAINAATGQITVNNSAAVDFETTPSFSLTVTVTDNGVPNETASATVTVTLNNANDPPVANNDTGTTNEDTTLNVAAPGVRSNDSDPEGDPLTASLATNAANGTATVNANGSWSYQPNANFSGTDSFTYQITDGTNTATATVTVTVNAVNDAPVNTVPAGTLAVAEDNSLLFTGANSISVADVDAGSANVQVLLNVSNGTLTLVSSVPAGTTGNGTSTVGLNAPIAAVNAALVSLRFDPTADYNGPAVLTIITNDLGNTGSGGSQSDTDTVNLNVTAVNDAPTANADATSAAEDTPKGIATATLVANDSAGPANEGGQTLTVTSVSATSTQGGTVTLVGATITYTPPANYNGSDSFTYTVQDDGTTNGAADPRTANGTVTVTVTEVNDAPVANADDLSTAEDTPKAFAAASLTTNDSTGAANESGQTLTVTAVSLVSAQGGSVTFVGGIVTYTPPANYNGADSFTYTVTDNGTTNGAAAPLTANGTVNVTVSPFNDAPVLTVAGAVTHTEGGPATTLATPASVTVNDVDDTHMEFATVKISGNFAAGQDVLSFTNTATITGNFSGDTLLLSGTDTKANYAAALQNVQYTNTSDAPSTLQRTITWIVSDGIENSNTQTTTLDVTATNDAPINTFPPSLTAVSEDVPVSFTGGHTISISDADAAGEDVRVTLNVSNGTVTLNSSATAALTSLTGDGTATVVATGSVAEINAALEGLTFTPTPNYNGPASIQIVTEDLGNNPSGNQTDTDTINITVNPANDAPVLTVTGAVTHTEGGAATNLATAANITDVDDTHIEGATIQITGNFASGQDVLSFATMGSISGTFVGNTLSLTGSGTLADYMAALQAVQYTNTSDTPSTLQRTITWVISDGLANSNTQTTTLDVTATNDAPIAANLSAAEAYTEDTPQNLIDIVITDADSSTVTATLTLSDTSAGSLSTATSGTTTSTYNAGTGVWSASGPVAEVNALLAGVTFNPAVNYNSNFSVGTSVSDGVAAPITGTKNFTGTAVNDAPALTVTASPVPNHSEGGAATAIATSVNITDVDDTNMESATISITANLSAGDTLNFVNQNGISGTYNSGTGVLSLTGSATLAHYIAALGSITYTTSSDNPSTAQRTITWVVNDGLADSNTQTTNLDVTPTNDAPNASNLSAAEAYTEDTPKDLVDIVITDADSSNVTATLTLSDPSAGSLSTATSGTTTSTYNAGTGVWSASGPLSEVNALLAGVTFNPATNYNGNFTVATSVSDGVAAPVTGTKNFTGTPANDAPALTVTASPTPAFSEGGSAVAIATSVNITDVDDTDMESATVSISNNFSAGDELVFISQNGINGSYNSVTGVLTLTGSSSLGNYITALGSITFSSASDNPSTAQRTISWTVNDGLVNSNTQTTAVNVSATNDQPVNNVPTNPQSTNEDTPLDFTGAGNTVSITDVDAGGGTIDVNIVTGNGTSTLQTTTGITFSGGSNGSANFVATGTLTDINNALATLRFTPAANFFSGVPATIRLITSDNGNSPAPAQGDDDTFAITVNSVNDNPINGIPSTPTFNEDTPHTFSGSAITVSDVDAGAGTIQVTLSTAAGTITLGGTTNLSFSFSDANGTGAGDGTADATMTFRGTLADVNAALQNTVFTPTANVSGAQSINMTTSDLGNSGSGGVKTDSDSIGLSITAVNDDPVNSVPASPQNMNQDSTLTFTGATKISISDGDAGSNTVQVTLNATSGTVSLSGTTGLSFSFSDANGTGAGDGTADSTMTFRGSITDVNTALNNLQFTSTPGFFSGPNAQLEIVTNDLGNSGSGGAKTDTDAVQIFVQQVNQAPVNSVPATTQTFGEDTTLTFTGGNAISISDPDAGANTVQVQLTATQGTLTLGGTTGLSFSFSDANGTGAGDGTADATMTFRGTIADINTALNNTTYTPNANYNGAATVTIVTNDLGNTGPGGAKTDTDVVNLDISPVNDAPQASNLNAAESYTEDTALNLTDIVVTDIDSANVTATLTLSDTAAGSLSTATSGTTTSTFSAGVWQASGPLAEVNALLAGVTFNPALNYNSNFTVATSVSDGVAAAVTGSKAFTGTAVNDDPQNNVPGTQTFNEDTPHTFSGSAISVTDVDVGSGNIQVTLSTTAGTISLGGTAGLSFVFSDANGTGAGDGTADATMTFRGTLAAVNTALQNTVFTPTANVNGPQTIGMTTNDLGNTGTGGAKTASSTINLSITAVNDAPELTNPASVNATEDVQFSFTGGNTISVTDVDSGSGTNFQATLSVTSGTLNVTAGSATVGGNNTSSVTITGTVAAVNTALGTVKYTGGQHFNGTDTLVVNVTDNGQTGTGATGTDSANITINVAAVNDPPVAQDKVFSAQAHMTIQGLTGLLTGVTDADNGTGPGPCSSTTFTVSNITVTNGSGTATLTNASTGTFDFSPAQGFTGAATLTYTVDDAGCPGTATSAAANITINVAGPAIYFVKSVAAGSGNCTLGNECTLATAVTAIGAGTNRHIFISDANTHNPGVDITLNSGNRILGQGVAAPVDADGDPSNTFDDLFDIAPPSGTIARPALVPASRPTIQNSTINLHNNSHARGFNLLANDNGLVAAARSGLKISDMNLNTTSNSSAQWAADFGSSSGEFAIGTVTQNTAGANGSGVRFANTNSSSTVTIGNISMQGTGLGFSGISTGSTNFSFGNVNTTAGAAVTTNTSSGNFTFGNITSTTGAALSVTSSGAGDFTAGTVSSTTGTAVSVTTATGDFSFTAVSANGAAKGITVNGATGTFTVNGTGTTDGTGGTIQNTTGRGAEFISSNNITLKNMNFTTNGTSQTVTGSSASCGGNLLTGNNLSCVGAIHLQTASTVVLDNLNVTGSHQMGINGNGVSGFSLANSSITNNGNETSENGLTFQNLTGTSSINHTLIRDNFSSQMVVANIANNSTLTLNITGTRTNNAYPTQDTSTTMIGRSAVPVASEAGFLVNTLSTATNVNVAVNLTGVVMNNNYPANALFFNTNSASGALTGTTTNSSFDSNAGGVIIQAQNGMGGTYNVTSSEFNRTNLQAILYSGLNPFTGTLQGTIQGNTIGTAGQSGSACFPTSGSNCVGIDVNLIGGSGAINVRVGGAGAGQPNTVQQFDNTGIRFTANGSGSMQANVENNVIQSPLGLIARGIDTNIGTTTGATVSGCFGITNNTVSGTYEDPGVGTQFGIHTRVRFSASHRLPGYGGAPDNDTAVAAFISGNNPAAGGKVFSESPAGSTAYPGGAACTTP